MAIDITLEPYNNSTINRNGKNIVLAHLPWAYCQEDRKLIVEYFAETYPVEVVAIGYKPLYDPENLKPRT